MNKEYTTHLGCWRDKTYCASPDCKNECGRKMGEDIKAILENDKYSRISYALFCDEPNIIDNRIKEDN